MADDRIVRSIFLLVAIAFVLLAIGVYSAYRNLDRIVGFLIDTPDVPKLKLPEGMTEPRVVLGQDLLKKESFYSNVQLGRVTDIRLFPLRPAGEPLLALVGDRSAVFLSAQRAPMRTVQFASRGTDRVVLVDLEGDGNPEFLNRGSWAHNVVLFDSHGRELWTYGGMPGVNDAAAGDVDGDGAAEIVVGFNGGGGVHLLDARGKRLWRKWDGNVWQVAMADVNGDGRAEILHSNVSGALLIRDATGRVILKRDDLDTYFSDFILTDWGPNRAPGHVLGTDDGELLVFTIRGDRVGRLLAPDCLGVADPYGMTWVHPAGGVHYAALASYTNWDRTALYVYDASLAIVYHEVLDSACTSLDALRSDRGETLLVGCEDIVWEYSWKSPVAH